jgi:hypothetical protein
MVMPTFFKPIGLPTTGMTPRPQAPLSADMAGFVAALDVDAGFLTAGLTAVGPAAGRLCAQAHDTKHDRATTAATDRMMNAPGRTGIAERLGE